MDLRVLGPVEASVGGRLLALGAVKQRAVFAMLVLHANHTVSADQLMEGLWGEHPPASASKLVQQHVSRLRRLLAGGNGGAEILTRGRGYELRIAPEDVDVTRFERLVADGAGRRALAMWRGPPLADVADEPFAASEIRRLEELRLTALEQALEADLAAGRHLEALAELATLVDEHPLSERLHGHLMLALYRAGRQADALAAYRQARRVLVESAGVEPGPQLRRLHEAVLRQDPALEPLEPAELPPELETVSPLVGRDVELERLRDAWSRRGAVVVVSGPEGIGRTRLVAELAGEVVRQGAVVLYGSDAAARARAARRPTLLVLGDVADARALDQLARELQTAPVLIAAITTDVGLADRLPGVEHLALGPLRPDAIALIAAAYAPSGTRVPVADLARRSAGVPAAAHRLSAEWARAEAEHRLLRAAARTATERSVLRRGERELAGSVFELQSVRGRAELQASGKPAPVCPFKGLSSFQVDDAEFFFGRERLIAELIARLVGSPLLGIVGPSGSGKSSALRAGLLAALAAGVLPGSEHWAVVMLRPGEHPLRSLEQALARGVPGERRMLLVADQFEETFTLCRDETERAAFVDALVAAPADGTSGAAVIVVVRADFYGRCAAYLEFGRILGANHVLVGPMQRDELRRAIELPARRASLRVEAELVDRVVADVDGEPGALPLLSSALLELWQHRDGRDLRTSAYEAVGGVRGAVGRLAEQVYGRFAPPEQVLARRILLRLTGEGVAGTPVRRRVALEELGGGDTRQVLDALAAGRLITVSEGTVEVAHEALLTEWPRLQVWLDEDAEGRRVHRHLIRAAQEWSERGDDRTDLYRGSRLAAALEWRAAHEPELNAEEQRFLDAGRAASERARRRVHVILACAIVLVAVTASAAVVALDGQGHARDQARVAEAGRLGAQALTEPALDRALLLARQGVALDDSSATRADLIAAVRRSPAAIGVMRGDGDALSAVALDPSDRTLAVGDYNGSVVFLDTRTRRELGTAHESGAGSAIHSLAFSPDGTLLASGGSDSLGGFVDLFDGRTHRYLTRLSLIGQSLRSAVDRVSFSPDSRLLAAQIDQGPGSSNLLFRWNARTQRSLAPNSVATEVQSSTLLGFTTPLRLLTMSATDGITVSRDAATLRAVGRFPVAAADAVLSPDRRTVAYGGRDGSVRLMDVRDGRVRTAVGGQDAPVTAMRFCSSGSRLVTAARDQHIIVWDTRRAAPAETLADPGGVVNDLAIASDCRTAYSVSGDGTVVIWDLSGSRRFERPFSVGGASLVPGSLRLATGGTRFTAVDAQGFADVFERSATHSPERIRVSSQPARGAALAPDGRTLAATTADRTLGFWDTRTGRRLATPLPAHSEPASALTFSADGRWLATGGAYPILRLWDARRRVEERTYVLGGAADLSLSNDGTTLAATLMDRNFNGGLEILSVPALKVIRTVAVPAGTFGRFSRDGRWFIYGDRQGRVWTFDAHTWKPRARPLAAHTGAILTAELSNDGHMLATTSIDGTARLWDAASRRPISADLPDAPGAIVGTVFTPQDNALVVVHERGGYVSNVRPSSWASHACAVAGRTLTRAEWHDALPNRKYAPACARR